MSVAARLHELDYGRLKLSLEFLVHTCIPADLLTAEADPLRVLERVERDNERTARRGLIVAIADFVEMTQDFTPAQVEAADSELARRGAYTLSILRSRFSRRRNKA
jgi:hypothetical protein